MKKLLKISALIAVAATSMFVSSCDTPTPTRPSVSSTTYVNKPVITIRNNSYKSIVVGVEGREKRFISVPARSSRVVYLKSGTYKYAAAARNTRTISGYKTFYANKRYTWTFGTT